MHKAAKAQVCINNLIMSDWMQQLASCTSVFWDIKHFESLQVALKRPTTEGLTLLSLNFECSYVIFPWEAYPGQQILSLSAREAATLSNCSQFQNIKILSVSTISEHFSLFSFYSRISYSRLSCFYLTSGRLTIYTCLFSFFAKFCVEHSSCQLRWYFSSH